MSVVFDPMTGRLLDNGAAEREQAAETKPTCKHGCETTPCRHTRHGRTLKADRTDIGLRGLPVIGHGSGAISGTSPGGELGAAARLERAGRELVRAHRNRFKAKTA